MGSQSHSTSASVTAAAVRRPARRSHVDRIIDLLPKLLQAELRRVIDESVHLGFAAATQVPREPNAPQLRKGRLHKVDMNPKVRDFILTHQPKMSYPSLAAEAKRKFGRSAPSASAIHRWCQKQIRLGEAREGWKK